MKKHLYYRVKYFSIILICCLIFGCDKKNCSDDYLTLIKISEKNSDSLIIFFKKTHLYNTHIPRVLFVLEAHNSFLKDVRINDVFSEITMENGQDSWPLQLEPNDTGIISKSSNRFFRLVLKDNYTPIYLDSLNRDLQKEIEAFELFGVLQDGNKKVGISKTNDFLLCMN